MQKLLNALCAACAGIAAILYSGYETQIGILVTTTCWLVIALCFWLLMSRKEKELYAFMIHKIVFCAVFTAAATTTFAVLPKSLGVSISQAPG